MPLMFLDDLRLTAAIGGLSSGSPLVLLNAPGTDLSIRDKVARHC